MADENKKDDEENLDDKAKGDTTDDKPPADDKKKDEASDDKKDDEKGDDKEELTAVAGSQAFTDAFGDAGAKYFCKGMKFEAAAKAHFAAMTENHKSAIKVKDDQIAKLTSDLDAAKALSGNKPLPARADGDKQDDPPAQLAQGLSAGLSKFAASLKVKQPAPASKK